jgi:hypothetical protein
MTASPHQRPICRTLEPALGHGFFARRSGVVSIRRTWVPRELAPVQPEAALDIRSQLRRGPADAGADEHEGTP